ncbi:MAG: hypothetical protein B7Z40_08605 [Bosea sp. 12-68-7]|nr:MAG: hypothetical protein B7Z40_08605 [Bosea sp. 12-68-7]OYW98000.1 MAG: hypothetical protein B7Z14_16130 [Bosea sp. 32-68-6]
MNEFERIADDIDAAQWNGLICPLQAMASYRRVRGIARLVESQGLTRNVGLLMAISEAQRAASVPPLGDPGIPPIPFTLESQDDRPQLESHHA